MTAAQPHPRTWCEVSRAALEANVRVLRARLAPGARLGVVVKSNAYGHGMVECARVFLEGGADWLIVNTIDEATALRAAEISAPIYVCGPVMEDEAAEVARSGARIVLYDRGVLEAVAAQGRAEGRVVPVHLKIETGNHRQGLPLHEAVELARRVSETDGVSLEGIATHFADIEDTTDHQFAASQSEAFAAARAALVEAGLEPPMTHAANSAATILWPHVHGDLVRVGISAYGLWPSSETYATALQVHAHDESGFVPRLTPAIRWCARIAQIKDVPAGGYVGYGRTFRATHPMRIGVLPVGYHEGYDRRLSNLAHGLLAGSRVPVRGRVCMNMTMLDLTHVPLAAVGDTVTLLGPDGGETVSAEQIAGWMGSINYEVPTGIHPSVPRVIVS
ncbi:MAG: alanine racemase [Deltaproteobacteria bacterium]|nr:alanine racemase [Deltaproteobacteria bacterium]